MTDIIQITKSRIQENGARILKEKQADSASALKLLQEADAKREQATDAFGPPTEELHSARQALKDAQKDAAHALDLSQQEAAKTLATANAKFNQATRDHEQAMNLVVDGYSTQPDTNA